MWLSDKLKSEEKKNITPHKILQSGNKPVVNLKGKVNTIFPFGIYSVSPKDTNVVCQEENILGTVNLPKNIPSLEAGEVCLYSDGGYILLKNNGEVIINGKKLQL